MDQQAKREKEREKKRRQREKLKLNKEKYEQSKRKDAARKQNERDALKENVAVHPRKYKHVVEKARQNTAERVRKCREKKKAQSDSPVKHSAQKLRRQREKQREYQREHRREEKIKKLNNRMRVTKYRLRVKLNTPQGGHTPKTPTNDVTFESLSKGYKHRSSEYRAFRRVENTLPSTPAKKVRIIEKLVSNTTPRSRHVLSQSPVIQSAINPKMTRIRLSTQFAVTESLRQNSKTSAKIVAIKLLQKSRKVSAASSLLNVSRKTIARSIRNEHFQRKRRKDKVSCENMELVQDFYLDEASRQMPNKRDVLLISDSEGKKQPIQKHLMEMRQSEAYQSFKAKNPNVKVGQRKFDMLRPIQVRRTNVSNRIVCCCTYCENIRLKTQALNKITKHDVPITTKSLTDLTMCNKNGDYHLNECIHRNCDNCGTKLLKEKFAEELNSDGDNMVVWKCWEKKRVPLDDTRYVSRVVLSTRESTLSDFINELIAALEPHAEHLFRAAWQYDQFRENVQNIKEGEVVMAMDFSENYTCRYGREIQSVHWNQKQITIHPMMLYYKKDGELKKEGFTAISDDLKHDSFAVSEYEQAAVKHLRDNGVSVNEIHQWTDGCASQYKCKHSFSAISNSETVLNATVTRNYFETSHGKGPCDGLGGIIKRKVSNSVIQDNNTSITGAQELTKFCDENLKSVGGTSSRSRMSKYAASSRSFKYTESIDRSKVTSAKTLTGSRKLHSVRSSGINHQLQVRAISCYCAGCRANTNCENQEYVDAWNTRVLRPDDISVVAPERCDAPFPEPPTGPAPESDSDTTPYVSPESDSDTTPYVSLESDSDTTPTPNEFVAIKFQSKKAKVCFFAKFVRSKMKKFEWSFWRKKQTATSIQM